MQKVRAEYQPKLPPALRNGAIVNVMEGEPTTSVADQEKIKELFPATFGSPMVAFDIGSDPGKADAVNVGLFFPAVRLPADTMLLPVFTTASNH